ncbi:DUF2793 domain-containing protein [Sphingomonas sp. G124]|uniref:DUF2793 domain-containing protein n=1 Tax=Sphingomonas cremea TaxID=2904799 RepID=A0A9X1TY91_9SPHN|nr:DUF2793 domain-containing protein [Sphingomonas cremea]MCF2514582.1 DUF2793 domain-containing protein [Sphingomonas cremea]
MDQTPRFALPHLYPGQTQKEWFHNEALQRIDVLLCPAVDGPAMTSPPASPAVGACFLIASGATGAWAGKDGSLAAFTDGGWRFVAPVEGAQVLDRSSGQSVIYREGSWETGIVRAQEIRIDGLTILRDRQPAIADPAGGSIVDGPCRAAVAAMLTALRTHGLIA